MSINKPRDGKLPLGLIPPQLTPERVLFDAELPVLYTTRTVQGQRLLAYVCDINDSGLFTLLVPLADQTLKALESGSTSVLEALSSSQTWLHWTDGQTSEAWAYDLGALPVGHLPEPRLPINPELEPIWRTRAIGHDISLGRIPASAVVFVADATRKAFKTVLDYVFAVDPEGRPSNEHRTRYDLAIQGFAFASFELSFAAPEDGMFADEEFREAAQKLEDGLIWASSNDQSPLDRDSADEREAILRAVLYLTPPNSGPVSQVEVSGAWITGPKILLTRGARRKVQAALRDVDPELPVIYRGTLDELDAGRLTFTLRNMPDIQEKRGGFSEDLLDDMLELLTKRVIVAGSERRAKFTAYSIVEDRTPAEVSVTDRNDAFTSGH